MLEEKFDFVIIINGLSTNFKNKPNELIELNWCTYDLKKKSVNSDLCAYIKPESIKEIESSYLNEYNIDITQLDKADDLLEVLKKFNTFVFETFINNNFSFALLTKDDWLLGYNGQLILEAQRKKIKLGYHFIKYLNLIREFKAFYNIEKLGLSENPSLIDILQFYSLKKQVEVDRPTLQELNTMVRIVNRMVKEGYEINSRKLISSESEFASGSGPNQNIKEETINPVLENENGINNANNITTEKDNGNDESVNVILSESETKKKKKEAEINFNTNAEISSNCINKSSNTQAELPTWHKHTTYYLRLKNFPANFHKSNIQEILYLYNLSVSDIAESYDIFNNKTGEFCIKVYDNANCKQILTLYNFRQFMDKLIEIVPSSASDFNSCLKSEEDYKDNQEDKNNLQKIKKYFKKIFLKIKNVPYSAKEESIKHFFRIYYPAENGIKLFKNKKGNFLGEAIIAFNTEEEALKALKEKNGEAFMNQIISLELTNSDEFELYANTNGFFNTVRNISEYVQPEIVTRSIFISGLPLGITKSDILTNLEIFNVNESNLIIDEKTFLNYGCLILKMPSEDDATFAKNYINKGTFKFRNKEKKINADNLLLLVNKGNES